MPDKIYNGLWWLPESPDNKVLGVLTVHKFGRISLVLNDSINNDNKRTSDNQKIDIIYGEVESKSGIYTKKLITLEDAYGNNFFCKYDVIRAIIPNFSNSQHFEPTPPIINSVQLSDAV